MNKVKYYLSPENEFVIENYNQAPTFASFFPGIAGPYGCPMWVFYANRGQCLTSAGVRDKDGAIMEFQPANKAFGAVPITGFRTFLKVDGVFCEPFSECSACQSEMRITPDSLKIIEENQQLKLKIEVTYFTVPHESFPALARKVKITNLVKKTRRMEIVDGLPTIIPYGFTNDLLKSISQTTAAWCLVENLDRDIPFFRLKVTPADICEVQVIEKGHFYLALSSHTGVQYIVEPTIVFGNNSSLVTPENFIGNKHFSVPAKQLSQGFIPCAMAFKKFVLAGQSEFELVSLVGQAENIKHLSKIKQRATSRQYFAKKYRENKQLIDGICELAACETAAPAFDLYARQSFLDNTMRGGLPVKLGNKILYLYYRKHGDMERDYNNFKLMPTFFSQGNGNYRDMNQNRRNDVFFVPEVAEDNIVRFFNLIQLDGFNPLVVLGSSFYLKTKTDSERIIKKHIKGHDEYLIKKCCQPFLLGSLLKEMAGTSIEYKTSRDEFVADLINHCAVEEGAVHGEGYWIDHPFYNLDLLESFEAIYPDKIADLLFNRKVFTFYDNDHVVHARAEKYFLENNKVRQYKAVQQDLEKTALLSKRDKNRNLVRTNHGQGEIYETTLIVKLLCLAVNKAALFDAAGIGLEMEADKPDWYDALNGLPGLLGSSLSETLELKRLALYTLNHLAGAVKIDLPVEIKDFIDALNPALAKVQDSFAYWQQASHYKEEYRAKTKLGLSGREAGLKSEFAARFLQNIVKKCDTGIKKCLRQHKNYFTYFINEAVDYEEANGRIIIKRFKQIPLPLFLEGFVHALKVERDRKIYQQVRNSPLYDRKLKMYKVNASLEKMPVEIGRAKIFTPGWLENESIWLHMEYKYMLELLKAGLYREFFADFKNVLIPFLDPQKYGRSILENSSFLVSSANPNQHNYGRGFVARLSGATAEFIDLWLYMMTGKKIFFLDQNSKLCFKLSPILPGWLFKDGKLTFKLLGTIEVTYINKQGKNTFDNGVKPVSYKLALDDHKEVDIERDFIAEPFASLIRERKVKKVAVILS